METASMVHEKTQLETAVTEHPRLLCEKQVRMLHVCNLTRA